MAAETLVTFDDETILAVQDTSCSVLHQQGHGGKEGYQPFIDRKRGYCGVFATRDGDECWAEELSLPAAVRLYAGLSSTDELDRRSW